MDAELTWLPRQVMVEHERIGGKMIKSDVVLICLKENTDDVIIPHPISNFIVKEYKNKQKSLSTQLRASRIICMFLNYINTKIAENDGEFIGLKSLGIKGLKLKHGARFISYGTYKGNNTDTVNYWEVVLTKFYNFLSEQLLIDSKIKVETIVNKNGKTILMSPFGSSIFDIERPHKQNDTKQERLKSFGKNRYDLVKYFIQLAEIYVGEIALGIYFQLFGGLRNGEVVNLTVGSLKPGGFRLEDNKVFFVDIDDRQEYLFSHLKNNQDNQVKRERIQYIIHSNILDKLYDNHMKKLKELQDKGKIKVSDALFVSHSDGVPISGANYKKKFDRLKEIFIQQLREEGYYQDVEYLESLPWSTHIGRGVFTNLLIDQGLDIEGVRDARGDKDYTSAISYVEECLANDKLQKVMKQIADNVHSTQYDEINRKDKLPHYDRMLAQRSGD